MILRKISITRIVKGLLLLFLVSMLVFSETAIRGAREGLLLWFQHVLPTLLPFIIVSNLIIRLNLSKQISSLFHPVLGRLLRLSKEGCYPIVIGFLSGIPMGGKTSADLVMEQRISKNEGQFLLTLCNNASPMFIIGYISVTQLKLPHIKYALFVIIYGSVILGALFCRNLFFRLKSAERNTYMPSLTVKTSEYSKRFSFQMVDNSIMNGFEIITRIGGYIILFSILAYMIKEINIIPDIFKACLMGVFEITTGISQISSSTMSNELKIVLITVITTFGGFSGIAQTKSVLQESGLSIHSYFIVKLISSIIAFLMATVYVRFFFPH
ncbi:MAG: transporter [Mobilitalea sp.]